MDKADKAKELMRIYIMVGEYDLAIQQVRMIMDHTGFYSVNRLKLDPLYDPLRNLPEFQAILADPKYQIDTDE